MIPCPVNPIHNGFRRSRNITINEAEDFEDLQPDGSGTKARAALDDLWGLDLPPLQWAKDGSVDEVAPVLSKGDMTCA